MKFLFKKSKMQDMTYDFFWAKIEASPKEYVLREDS